jgi:hypothetical protein
MVVYLMAAQVGLWDRVLGMLLATLATVWLPWVSKQLIHHYLY